MNGVGVGVAVGVALSAGVDAGDTSGVVGKACSPASGVEAGEGVGDASGLGGADGRSPALAVGTGVASAVMFCGESCIPGVGEETGVASAAICNFGFAASHPTDASKTTHPSAIKDLRLETNFLIDILVLQNGACAISPSEPLDDSLNWNRIEFLPSDRRSHLAEP
jgi:hypothetical protein